MCPQSTPSATPSGDGSGTITVYGDVRYGRTPQWLFEAMRDGQVTSTAVVLYGWIMMRYANLPGGIFPRHGVLAEDLGLGVNTVRDALRSLRAVGALTVHPTYRTDGGQMSNIYVMAWLGPHQFGPATDPPPTGSPVPPPTGSPVPPPTGSPVPNKKTDFDLDRKTNPPHPPAPPAAGPHYDSTPGDGPTPITTPGRPPHLGPDPVEARARREREDDTGIAPRAGHRVHPAEPNALAWLTRIIAERQLPLGADELLDHAYRLGNGDPWAGRIPIASATDRDLGGIREPRRAIRARLRDARPVTTTDILATRAHDELAAEMSHAERTAYRPPAGTLRAMVAARRAS